MALTSHCASIKYFFFFNIFGENSLSLVRDRFDLDCVREKPALGLRKKLGENTETASNVVGKGVLVLILNRRTVGNLSHFCRRRPCGAGPGTLVLARSLGVSNVVFCCEVV